MNKDTWFFIIAVSALALDVGMIVVWRSWRQRERIKANFRRFARALKSDEGRTRTWSVMMFGLAVLLATIPAWLVIRDRWFDKPFVGKFVHEWWYVIGLQNFLPLPVYFILIFPVIPSLFILIGLAHKSWPHLLDEFLLDAPKYNRETRVVSPRQKRLSGWVMRLCGVMFVVSLHRPILYPKRLPGFDFALAYLLFLLAWLLRDVPFAPLFAVGRKHAARWAAMFAAHAALLFFLWDVYTGQGLWWLSGGMLALGFGVLLRYRQHVSPVYWVISGALVLYTFQINAWWFSLAGDEYPFYWEAVAFAQERSLKNIHAALFGGQLVYRSHPVISTLLQAVFIKIFGQYNFSWRLSSLYFTALSLGAFYAFLKVFLRQKFALLAVIFLAMSHYIMSFGKIGYNNLQALAALLLALWAASRAMGSPRVFPFVFVGAVQAFCFYLFPAALYAVPLPLLLLWIFDRPRTRAALRRWAAMLGALLLGIAPLFLQPAYWQSKVAGTFFIRSDVLGSWVGAARHFLSNLLFILISPLYAMEESHFVAVGDLDPMTAGLAILGLMAVLWVFRARRFTVFLMASFLMMVAAVGTSHGYGFPPYTRKFMMLPWYAVFAAAGLGWLGAALRGAGMTADGLKWATRLALGAVLLANLYQAYPLSYRRMGRYQDIQQLFLRTASEVFARENASQARFVVINDPVTLNIPSIHSYFSVYRLPFRADQIVEIIAETASLDAETYRTIAAPAHFVIINPTLDPLLQEAYARHLAAVGKEACPMVNVVGRVVFTLWHDPGESWVCY